MTKWNRDESKIEKFDKKMHLVESHNQQGRSWFLEARLEQSQESSKQLDQSIMENEEVDGL